MQSSRDFLPHDLPLCRCPHSKELCLAPRRHKRKETFLLFRSLIWRALRLCGVFVTAHSNTSDGRFVKHATPYRICRVLGSATWIAPMARVPARPINITANGVPQTTARAPISMLPNVITTLLM
jgi:hypothetical protein